MEFETIFGKRLLGHQFSRSMNRKTDPLLSHHKWSICRGLFNFCGSSSKNYYKASLDIKENYSIDFRLLSQRLDICLEYSKEFVNYNFDAFLLRTTLVVAFSNNYWTLLNKIAILRCMLLFCFVFPSSVLPCRSL